MSLHFGNPPEVDESSSKQHQENGGAPDGSPTAANDPTRPGRKVEMDWTAGDDEDQVVLRVQSKLMVAMPPPEDTVLVEFKGEDDGDGDRRGGVRVDMRVVRRRDPLTAIMLGKAAGSGQQSDGVGVLTRLLRCKVKVDGAADGAGGAGFGNNNGGLSFAEHWSSVTALSLSGCGISVSCLLCPLIYLNS